ncbi:MAG: hypothetical protein WCK47_04505 [bacterium]|nr:hypothetical protein [Candidatus Sumerlaeota bacterium]
MYARAAGAVALLPLALLTMVFALTGLLFLVLLDQLRVNDS